MSPSLALDASSTMFSRSGNLSTRRPLLEEGCHYATIVPVSPAPSPHSRPLYPACLSHHPYTYQRQTSFKAPSPNHYHPPVRLNSYADPYKVVTPASYDYGRQEPELVFRFDPQPSDEYFAAPQVPGSVHYTKGSISTDVGGHVYENTKDIVKANLDKNGPFVFGVHTPSQFKLTNETSDDDYDYADVDENTDVNCEDYKTNEVNCCDKVTEWKVKSKVKSKNALYRIFQIKDNRCIRKCSAKSDGSKKKDKIKCVLVGDGAVGKSTLIAAYAQNKFRDQYEPTAFDNFNVVVEVDDRPVTVQICDTAGQDNMAGLRALCYPGTDVVLVCFSVVRPDSFRAVGARWLPAVRALHAPLVLVGTQHDLAADPAVLAQLAMAGERVVGEAEARALARGVRAPYVPTSARTGHRLKEAFDAAILAALSPAPTPAAATAHTPRWSSLLCCRPRPRTRTRTRSRSR